MTTAVREVRIIILCFIFQSVIKIFCFYMILISFWSWLPRSVVVLYSIYIYKEMLSEGATISWHKRNFPFTIQFRGSNWMKTRDHISRGWAVKSSTYTQWQSFLINNQESRWVIYWNESMFVHSSALELFVKQNSMYMTIHCNFNIPRYCVWFKSF